MYFFLFLEIGPELLKHFAQGIPTDWKKRVAQYYTRILFKKLVGSCSVGYLQIRP